MKGYYKRRYGIGIYKRIVKAGDIDELVELFDNAEQFAEFLGRSIKKARDILALNFHNKTNGVVIEGKKYDIAFIPMTDE